MEVWVQPWPALDRKYLVSADGGEEPLWSHDGTELYFRSGDAVMRLHVGAGEGLGATAPVVLFRGPYAYDAYRDQSYDVAPDGRFLMLRRPAEDPRLEIHVVLNWITEARRALGSR